jgi:hypothetical protein
VIFSRKMTIAEAYKYVFEQQYGRDIYFKPLKTISYIQLNFIAVRTGVTFEEVVGKFDPK